MKHSLPRSLALVGALAVLAAPLAAQLSTPPPGGNQKSVVTQYMGPVSVTITYNSPDVTAPTGEDRTGQIWGQLVPWGIAPNPFYPGFGTAETMPWRAGANENTTISFSHDVEVEGKALAAGTYGLHMAPGQEEWIVIFNRNTAAWGSFFYDAELDALRVTVQPQEAEAFREWLTFEFRDRQLDTTLAVLHWENLEVPFRISVPDLPEITHARLSEELTGAAGFQFQNLVAASQWAAAQPQFHASAERWADAAIANTATFQTLSNKAAVQMAVGKSDEALATLEQAVAHPTATANAIHMAARQLQFQGQMEAANKIFRLNHEKHPGEWPTDFGMARAYAQEGNFEKALEHARIALGRAPEGPQKQNLETQIERLEKGENINP